MPEENFCTLWCNERLTDAITQDNPAGRHSIRTNQCPPPPSPIFLQAGCPSCRPTDSVKALKATSAFGYVLYVHTVHAAKINKEQCITSEPLTSKKSRNVDDFSNRTSFANVGPNGGTFLERETAMLKQNKNSLPTKQKNKTIFSYDFQTSANIHSLHTLFTTYRISHDKIKKVQLIVKRNQKAETCERLIENL